MVKRIISALVMIAIALPTILFGGLPFKALMVFVGVGSAFELCRLKDGKLNIPLFIVCMIYMLTYAFYNYTVQIIPGEVYSKDIMVLIQPVYIVALFILSIYNSEKASAGDVSILFFVSTIVAFGAKTALMCYEHHQFLLLYVLLASLGCDTGAYFIGINFGKHKIAPVISPKKTVEGCFGGVITGFAISLFFASFFGFFGFTTLQIVVISFVLPIVSEFGDLAFSLVKRYYGVKDFSNLIPGHGGILDRIDSVFFCLLLMSFILNLI